MKLQVCRVPGGNFGDDLNDILWPALFPDILDAGGPAQVFGIGSILGGEHEPSVPKVVLGSGLGYQKCRPLDASWDVRWVRGALSARALGLGADLAMGDAALLWPALAAPSPTGDAIGLIPHHASWESFDWQAIAAQAGLLAINPKHDPDSVRRQLGRCRSVLAESLHGAIFADCLRIPWQSVALSYRFNRFKWKDWISLAGGAFQHASVPFPLSHGSGRLRRLKHGFARRLIRDNDGRLNSLRPAHASLPAESAAVVDFLGQLAHSGRDLRLTDPEMLARQRERMAEAGRRFARKYGLRCTL